MKPSCILSLAVLLVLSVFCPLAHATVDEGTVPRSAEEKALEWEAFLLSEQKNATQAAPLDPLQAYLRTQAVLEYYEVPVEPDTQPALEPLAGRQSESGIRAILQHLDIRKQFDRFFSLQGGAFSASRDRDSKRYSDYAVALDAHQEDQSFSASRLATAVRANPLEQPLQGLRVAIDPGHMGSDLWDNRTGKYIRDRATGRKVSEGVIALQTALLLEERLRSLGADVMLTRRSFTPVTQLRYEDLEVRAYGRTEIRQSTLAEWFQQTLLVGGVGAALFRAFDARPEVRKAFGEFSRGTFFISREDLSARARMIDEYEPDLTIYVHYDAAGTPSEPNGINPNGRNGTKVYVPGAFSATELGSREDRRLFALHILQSSFWLQSVAFSKAMVSRLSQRLGVPFDRYGGEEVSQVAPGVFSRNLALTRRIPGRVSTFLEVMHYDNRTEFDALSRADFTMMIDGAPVTYSSRLVTVADALRDGVLDYLSSLRSNQP